MFEKPCNKIDVSMHFLEGFENLWKVMKKIRTKNRNLGILDSHGKMRKNCRKMTEKLKKKLSTKIKSFPKFLNFRIATERALL